MFKYVTIFINALAVWTLLTQSNLEKWFAVVFVVIVAITNFVDGIKRADGK